MNRIDKKIFEMAKKEEINTPKSYEDRVQKILDELPESQVEERRKLKIRPAFAMAAVLVLIMSVTAGATINAISKRMNDMSNKEKQQMITDMDKSNADKDSYSRKLTDSERERMDKLREQYENEGRFPEGKVAVVDKEEDAKEGQITFVTTTRTYVIPEKEMTDEQILQIIDYGYKEDYSLRQERRGTEENYDGVVSDEQVAENEEKIKSSNGMSKEAAKELAAKYIKNIYDIDVSEYDVDVNANYDSSYEVHFQKDNSIIVNIDAVNKQLEYIHIDEYEVENNNEKADENLFTNYADTVKEIIINKANLAEKDSKYHYEYTLTEDEKKKIKKMVIERVNGKIPILLGVGGNNTRAVVATLKNDDFTGVDAILSVVPYYNKPSQEGIYQHYKAISEATELPIVLYNVPGRTGVNMKAETTLRIARDFKNVIAIKEASGDITQMDDIIKNKPANFDVISGDDGITFPLITLGAVGIISVIGNAFPREFSRMVRLALQGDYQNALTIHHKFAELFKLLFVDGNPAGVKAMLNAMGMIENKLRLPLVPTRITTFEAMRTILNELNIKC